MKFRLLNVNTHVGQSLRPKRTAPVGMFHLKKKWKPDVVTVQEVNRPLGRARLRVIFPPTHWSYVGHLPPSIGPSSNGAIVIAKRSKFKKIGKTNKPLTAQRFVDGRRDKWHPSRRVVTAVLKFRKKDVNGKHKIFTVSSDHAWTAAGHPLNEESVIANTHKHQIRQFAGDSMEYLKRDDIDASIRAGDYNEGIDPTDRQVYVERVFTSAGLRSARPKFDGDTRLDEVWVSAGTKVNGYHVIPEREAFTDHDALVVDIEI